jgi:hypothetical protein
MPTSFLTHQLLTCFAILIGWLAQVATAAQPAKPTSLDFEKNILPILQSRCIKCHGAASPQAGLDVSTKASLLKGGASGAAMVVGKAEKSLLYQRVVSGQMPLGGPKLSKVELETIRLWIDTGAPAAHPSSLIPHPSSHWAFQPPQRPAVPKVKSAARVRTPIDAFVLAELEKKGLTFSPDADKVTLLRRAYFDLIGLPPTPKEVDEFLADKLPNAYEKVIDKLLTSERYGERWGRHWLDAAGYADSEGVLEEDRIRTNAWRYRDYVIRAFNSDKPYNRFLMEQLAGDELVDYRSAEKFTPDVVDCLEATGFLRTAVDATRDDFQPRDFAEHQWRMFFDTQQIVATSLMGLTVQCARCHDHKYEPISQRDYYRLQAFFAGAIRPNGPVLPSYRRLVTLATAAEQKTAEQANAKVDAAVKAIADKQAALLAEYHDKHPKKQVATDAELRRRLPTTRRKRMS